MPVHDTSNQLLSHNGLNSTYLPSTDTFQTQDDYKLRYNAHSSSVLEADDSDAIATATRNYSSTNGYGTINAAAAVARAIGQNTFADVPDLGGNNWGADLIKAPEAWKQGYTGKGIVVAVVDSGVDYNHEDLKNNIWTNTREIAGNGIDDDGNGYVDDAQGWNFANNNNNTLDDNGHGTHVAGTIAGENNNYGVTGIAYDAKIMPVKVLNESGSGSYSSISKGIRYAVDNGANVINLSLGGTSGNRTLESAIDYASSKGAIVVMAAGNDGGSSPEYPARYAYKSGIAVGAVDRDNNIADFSNRAGTNEITYVTAPGVKVYSSLPGNQYGNLSGTSMAAPHVAGVVALMLSANRNLTDAQVRQIVADTAGNSTQTSNSNLNNFDVSSLTGQAVAQSTTYLTPETISGSLIGQGLAQSTTYLTSETIPSFNNSNVVSLLSQAIAQGLTYITPETVSGLNNSNVASLIGQTLLETPKYLTPETISKVNNSDIASLISQALLETPKYLTLETISRLNNSDVGSLIGQSIVQVAKSLTSVPGNNGLANPQLWSQLQGYEKILSSVQVPNSNDDKNQAPNNNLDLVKVIAGIQKQLYQLEPYRKFLGL